MGRGQELWSLGGIGSEESHYCCRISQRYWFNRDALEAARDTTRNLRMIRGRNAEI